MREAGLDFEESKDYDWITKGFRYTGVDIGFRCYGYAEYYLRYCWNDSKLINEADVKVYQRLVDIDTTLGTGLSRQLLRCLCWTTRWDIIKVLKFLQIKDLKLF